MKVTIGANWDGGDYYPLEYVNRLYRAVERHRTIPFDFVLFIGPEAEKPGKLNGLESAVKVVPVGLPSWWSTLPWFMKNPPGVETDTILFLDLDIVILSCLNPILRFPSDLAMMKDYPAALCPVGHETDGNNGVTLIRNGAGVRVWEEYEKAGKPVWDALDTTIDKGTLRLAAMTIVNDPKNGIKIDLFPENWICSYKLQVLKKGLPEGCRIVHFHGVPKPHEVNEKWVKDNWI